MQNSLKLVWTGVQITIRTITWDSLLQQNRFIPAMICLVPNVSASNKDNVRIWWS